MIHPDVQEWLDELPCPDQLGSREYRALQEFIADMAEYNLGSLAEFLEQAEGALDEFIGYAQYLLDSKVLPSLGRRPLYTFVVLAEDKDSSRSFISLYDAEDVSHARDQFLAENENARPDDIITITRTDR